MKKYVPILCGLCAALTAGTQAFALTKEEEMKKVIIESLDTTIKINNADRQIPESVKKVATDLLNNNDFSLDQLTFLAEKMGEAQEIIETSGTSLKNLPSTAVKKLQTIAKETAKELGLTITLSDGLGFSVTDKAGRTYHFGYTAVTAGSSKTAASTTSSSASKVIKTTGMDVDYSGSVALLYFAIASIGAAAVVARKKKLFEGK